MGETIEKRIYQLLESGDSENLLSLLHCVDTDWAIRLLVGTYVDKSDYVKALEQLQRLPDVPENAEFVALYNAIISGGLQEQAGGGKADMAAAAVAEVAANTQSSYQSLAENILAVYRGYDYVRYAAPITYKSNAPARGAMFSLAPNPAQNKVAITWQLNIKTADVMIYDINGRLLSTFANITNGTSIGTESLPNGLYYCRLSGIAGTEKLVIIH